MRLHTRGSVDVSDTEAGSRGAAHDPGVTPHERVDQQALLDALASIGSRFNQDQCVVDLQDDPKLVSFVFGWLALRAFEPDAEKFAKPLECGETAIGQRPRVDATEVVDIVKSWRHEEHPGNMHKCVGKSVINPNSRFGAEQGDEVLPEGPTPVRTDENPHDVASAGEELPRSALVILSHVTGVGRPASASA